MTEPPTNEMLVVEPTRRDVLAQRRAATKAPWWHAPILWAAVGAFTVGLLAGAALVVPQMSTALTTCSNPEHRTEHVDDFSREWQAGYDAGKSARPVR